MTDLQALSQYARTHRRQDLSPLVERHLNWVHSCALRQVRGDPHLAGDVTQAVFLALAQRPPRLRDQGALAGWLFRVTRSIAARAIRSEVRRRKHEGRAAMLRSELADEISEDQWQTIAPILDELIGQLSERDRRGIVLRFFQRCSFEQVGRGMGISEEAARKCVKRAVEKLRQKLLARGVAASATGLGAGLLTYATGSAPAEVVAATGVVLSGGAGASMSVSSLAQAASAVLMLGKTKLTVAAMLLGVLLPVGALTVAQLRLPDTPAPGTQPTSSVARPAPWTRQQIIGWLQEQESLVQSAAITFERRVHPTPATAIPLIEQVLRDRYPDGEPDFTRGGRGRGGGPTVPPRRGGTRFVYSEQTAAAESGLVKWSFKNGMERMESYRPPKPDQPADAPVPPELVLWETFDGTFVRYLDFTQLPMQGEIGTADAAFWKTTSMPNDVASFWQARRSTYSQRLRDDPNLRIEAITIDGQECALVTSRHGSSADLVHVFDPAGRVLERRIIQPPPVLGQPQDLANKIMIQKTVYSDYRAYGPVDGRDIWFPRVMTTHFYMGTLKDGTPVEYHHVEVISRDVKFNIDIPDEQFTIEFPPGAQIRDQDEQQRRLFGR